MRLATIFAIVLTVLLAVSGVVASPDTVGKVSGSAPAQTASSINEVDITAVERSFEAPDEIPSGWTTFNLHNASNMVHFAIINKMPEGYGVEDHQEQVAPIFQEGMNLLNQEEFDAAQAKFGELPAWFGDVAFMGGPGFVSPGHVAQTTVNLEPGTYVLECYVKTNGVFHSYNASPDEYGMVHEFTVTEEANESKAPQPTVEVTVSSENGIEFDDTITTGYHTVAVNFEDQAVYDHFLGHDVQLVRLHEDTDVEALASWMNWTAPSGLETSAPAEFIGGTQDMLAGETAYVNVILSPGTYAWIAEVPDPAGKNMFHTFTVPTISTPES